MPTFRPKHSLDMQVNAIAGNRGHRSYTKRWLFFFVLLAFSGFVIYQQRVDLIEGFHAGDYQKMVVLLVVLFPMFFAIKVLAKGSQHKRFGDTPLTINPVPLVLGQHFNGVVNISRGASLIDAIQLSAELVLLEEYQAEQGDNHRVSHVDRRWQQPLALNLEKGAPNIQGGRGARLLIEGCMPDEQLIRSEHIVDLSDTNSRYFWRLMIKSANKKFKQSWDLPVAAFN